MSFLFFFFLSLRSVQTTILSLHSASVYSTRSVSETLLSLVKQGLKYYPQYFPWLRLNGEIEFGELNETYI